MRAFDSQSFRASFQALRPWILTFGIIWLLGTLGLGWLVKSFVFLILLLLLAPMILLIIGRWWLSRNVIQAPCPVCGFQLTGLSVSPTRCPSCNEVLEVKDRQFQRVATPGTIDVEVVDVTAQAMDE
ncbi:hypothetical protein [Lyngbya confervoides]|uniref:Uncharacterized protein n=1 Tax=Lyngbya confervoides BDU141951 TaxID=1574623 RepID=A0ABD4T6Z2_9CYAN|nr:hypothetical protein [Lyngbya confervoides]MCM1984512.1 hypothetical protein [Lyngbya confervoides BDU141951]